MKNISGMDYDNTPFNIPGKMVSGQDSPATIKLPYANANRRNVETIVKQINANAQGARKALADIRKELEVFSEIDSMSDVDGITISLDTLKGILSLVEKLNLSFENLLKATE
jgi:hypothetical protein